MPNTLATSAIVAKTALALIKNNCIFANTINRDYDSEYPSNMGRGYAPGQTINIKRPPQYTYRAGRVAVPQSTVENTVPLTLQQGGCDLSFTGIERTVSLTQLTQKIKAAILPVVNEIDRQGLDLLRSSVGNVLNPAGAVPTTQALAVGAMADLNRVLDDAAAPRNGERSLICSPTLFSSLIQGMSGMFNATSQIGKQNMTGEVDNAFGFKVGVDQNVSTQTNGAATATNINGANQTGSALTVVAVAGGTLTKGTSITLPGVFAVNPVSKIATSQLAMFVVTADALIGATTINVSPALVTSGAFQNVSASPTTGAAYVIQGAASTSYRTNVAYSRDAVSLAMVPLWMPTSGKGVVDAYQASDDGFTVSVIETFDAINHASLMRVDVLFGYAATYPQLACKYYTV